jgi:phage/plasmid-like protein (TIGR03299 family)
MAHRILSVDGRAQAWYQGTPAWHGLGEVTDDAKTARQVVKQIPVFQKRVSLAPVYIQLGKRMVEAPDFRATVREGDTTPLGIVSSGYNVIQDTDALLTLEAVVKVAKKATFVTAGALDNGWLFATIDLSRVFDAKVKRDPSRQESHFIGEWGHDGSKALNAWAANRRVECDNLRRATKAEAESKGLFVTIRHTGDVESHMQEAQRILGFAEQAIKADVEVMNRLADTPLPRVKGWWDDFLTDLIPIPVTMERPVAREEARKMIATLYAKSPTLVGVPESPYRVLQAVTEYTDHYRPLRVNGDLSKAQVAQKRFRSLTTGPGADLKARAMELLRQEFLVDVPA